MMAKMAYGIKLVVVAALVLCVQVLPVRAAWDAEVMGVPDGDSLKVKRNGKVYKVRIYGIDCPEYGQSEWRLARDFTRRLTAGRVVSDCCMMRRMRPEAGARIGISSLRGPKAAANP